MEACRIGEILNIEKSICVACGGETPFVNMEGSACVGVCEAG